MEKHEPARLEIQVRCQTFFNYLQLRVMIQNKFSDDEWKTCIKVLEILKENPFDINTGKKDNDGFLNSYVTSNIFTLDQLKSDF